MAHYWNTDFIGVLSGLRNSSTGLKHFIFLTFSCIFWSILFKIFPVSSCICASVYTNTILKTSTLSYFYIGKIIAYHLHWNPYVKYYKKNVHGYKISWNLIPPNFKLKKNNNRKTRLGFMSYHSVYKNTNHSYFSSPKSRHITHSVRRMSMFT